MTKKDYVKIADVVRNTREVTSVNPSLWEPGDVLSYMARRLADMLAQDNPPSAKTSGFDRERFYKACGFPS